MEKLPTHSLSRREFCAAALAVTVSAGPLLAAEDGGAIEAMQDMTNLTVGGKQFWADVWFFHDWRIQRHAITGHCRLLDSNNRRHTWGTFDTCRSQLDEIGRREKLPPMEGKAVVILHGLFRSRSAMSTLHKAIAKAGGHTVFSLGYPTTRAGISDHAKSLDSAIRSLEGMTEINFVAHSLGNLVVRHWLKDLADEDRSLPADQSFGRMVMLAPPNHQPQLATKLVRGALAKFVAGDAARQMAMGWKDLEPRLATPHFEFGILAGGKGDRKGYNPLIPGDDDGVVTIDSTRLAGARDFRRLPVLHSFFMNDKRVQELTLRFLTHGHFESEKTREPVEASTTSSDEP